MYTQQNILNYHLKLQTFKQLRQSTHQSTKQQAYDQSDLCKMQNNQHSYGEDFQNDSQSQNAEEYFIKQRLRTQAYKRTTEYTHPRINFFDHEPINSKQSEDLRKQLISLYKPKIQFVRSQYDQEELTKNYDNFYDDFIKMTLKNEIQQRQLTESISQMHEMADVLLNIPHLQTSALHLYSKDQPTEAQQDEIDQIFQKYETAFREGEEVQQNLAQNAIKRAKQFLRDRLI